MSATALKRENARERILDLAEAAVLQKGFGATSIEELIAGAGISKSGFFYHFPDKGELAKALLLRYIERDRVILDDIFNTATRSRCRTRHATAAPETIAAAATRPAE